MLSNKIKLKINKIFKSPKASKESKEQKEPKATKEKKEPKQPKEKKEPKAPKEKKEPKAPKAPKEPESPKEFNETLPIKKIILTEDLGKKFEMAICLTYGIEYDGRYKYDMEEPLLLKERLKQITELFPQCIHTAKRGSQYDFTACDNQKLHLSAKTTKGDNKVCPQVIGQPTRNKFCEFFKLDSKTNNCNIKKFIQNNIKELLKSYDFYTFDCPMIYYNKKNGSLKYITKIKDIEWDKYTFDFSHLHNKKNNYEWKESSSLYLLENNKKNTIGEFQIQNHRDSIKFRWSFINLLKLFSEHFTIINLL
jgi:hypothetical protein